MKDEHKVIVEETTDPEEVLELLRKDLEKTSPQPVKTKDERDLELAILNETDWRKRAALVALKISRGIDY